MTASAVAFYIISAFLLVAGLLSVTSRKIFRSAIWLLASLVGIAALYFWMQMEFIAAVQILVYLGGIVVLIIFSIFLTQESGKELPKPRVQQKIFSLLAVVFGFCFSYNLIFHYFSFGFKKILEKPLTISVSEMGTQLLSTTEHGYILPFEVVSILLLAALVGCIVIAMKPPAKTYIEPNAAEVEGFSKAPSPDRIGSPKPAEPSAIQNL